MDNILKNIPYERLSYELYKQGGKKAELEKDFLIKEHYRISLLAVITNDIIEVKGDSASSAERGARTSDEYKSFIEKMGESKRLLVLARAKYSAIDCEIKLRINKSFQDRTDYNSGEITT